MVIASPPWWRVLSQSGLWPRPTSTPASPFLSLCPPASPPLGDRHSQLGRCYFCVFKTAKGVALGAVHLTSHGQQTGLRWASVPRDVIFLPCSHPTASSWTGGIDPAERCRKWRGGSSTSLRGALPARPAPRHRAAAVPPSRGLPARAGGAPRSQLLRSLAPSCCSQETTASPISLGDAFWFNKQRLF